MIIHGIPPFSNRKAIDNNLQYLLTVAELTFGSIQSVTNHLLTTAAGFLKLIFITEQDSRSFYRAFRNGKRYFRPDDGGRDSHMKIERDMSLRERLERQPLMAITKCLTELPPNGEATPIYQEYLRPDWNSLQLWSPEDPQAGFQGILLAQVIFVGEVCKFFVLPNHKTHILENFGQVFKQRMVDTLKYQQAYNSAAQFSTTNLRYDYRQLQDLSNFSGEEAVRLFPYDIYPEELTPELQTQLSRDPGSLLRGMGGLPSIVQQALEDASIDPLQYGKGLEPRNKGKGKGKSKYKDRDRDASPRQGKGGRSNWWNEQDQNDSHDSRSSRPPATWGRKPQQTYDRGQDSRGTYFRPDDQKHTAPQGRWDQNYWQNPPQTVYQNTQQQGNRQDSRPQRSLDNVLVPCSSCSNLFGFNLECSFCLGDPGLDNYNAVLHLLNVRDVPKYHSFHIDSFLCFHEQPDHRCCEQPYGTNPTCVCCRTWKDWARDFHEGQTHRLNPIHRTVVLGYEKAILSVFEDEPQVFDEALQGILTGQYHPPTVDLPECFQVLMTEVLAPLSVADQLAALPRPGGTPQYFPPNQKFFTSPNVDLHALGYSVEGCNVQHFSWLLSLSLPALLPLVEDIPLSFGLPSLDDLNTLDPGLQTDSSKLVTLELLPWDALVRASYRLAIRNSSMVESWSYRVFESIAKSILYRTDDTYLRQLGRYMYQVIIVDEVRLSIFVGEAPFTNANLKQASNAGSCFLDLYYWQLTSLLKLQTTQSQLLQVPNDALVQIYDQILINSHPGDKLAQWYSSADGRHWNNKGNSLEAMSLLLVEQGYHELLVAFLWVIVQLHFQGKAFSFKLELASLATC